MPRATATAPVERDVDQVEWGRRLRDWRTFRGLTQVQLAKAVSERLARNIGQDAVSEWEHGTRRPTDPQRVVLSQILAVPPYELFPYPPAST